MSNNTIPTQYNTLHYNKWTFSLSKVGVQITCERNNDRNNKERIVKGMDIKMKKEIKFKIFHKGPLKFKITER